MTVKAWLLAVCFFQLALARQKSQQTEITVTGEKYNLTYEGQTREEFSINWVIQFVLTPAANPQGLTSFLTNFQIAESDSLSVKFHCRNCFFAKDSNSRHCNENHETASYSGSLWLNKSCDPENSADFSFKETICKKSRKISTLFGKIKCENEKNEEIVNLSNSSVAILAIISFLAILVSQLILTRDGKVEN